jgi:DNA helicase-2/ATP-dependent DNA helicase PcrA
MTTTETLEVDHLDDHVDDEIIGCLSLEAPKSFFLFAGAGSGKTRSLVNALDHVRKTLGPTLRLRNQRVAAITYTKAARDEIIRRTQFDSIIAVRTIHAFAWSVIEGFNHDIREWLRVELAKDIADLQAKEQKGRKGSKASAERIADIESKTRRLTQLDSIKRFIYNPDTDNRGKDSLNHSEVLEITGAFIRTKSVMQHILKDGFPFILVDESQDTNHHIVEALFALQEAHKDSFALGLLGDMMQRIYGDGQSNLGENLPADWVTPTKKLNFRCPRRVITLINKIREATDKQLQVPCSKAIEGHVRMFILPADTPNKLAAEKAIVEQMAALADDPEWTAENGSKNLILEHRMAARRLGFDEMFAPLYSFKQFGTGLLDGTLSIVALFSGRVLPLVDAKDDKFVIARIVRASSPLLSADALRTAKDEADQLKKAQAAVASLLKLFENGASPTFGQVLKEIASSGLFVVPDPLRAAIETAVASAPGGDDDPEDQRSERDQAINQFLTAPFNQVRPYFKYVTSKASFDTHQGVKGLEFPRVMVIMDDVEARGFQFKYEKLFGGATAEDGTMSATRRLFYVTCSRTERSLCLVAYTSDPERVRKHVVGQGWFESSEVQVGL